MFCFVKTKMVRAVYIAMNRNPLYVQQAEDDCIICRVSLHNAVITNSNKSVETLQCCARAVACHTCSHACVQLGDF